MTTLIIKDPLRDLLRLDDCQDSISQIIFADRASTLDEDTALTVARTLQSTSSLGKFYLFRNQVSSRGLDILLQQGLALNTTLRTVHLCAIPSILEAVSSLSQALAHNDHIQELHLWDNQLDCKHAIDIAKGIECNKSLQKLHLPRNKIGSRGSLVLLTACSAHPRIQEVNLSYNAIDATFDASTALSNTSSHLKMIHLEGNDLKDGGAQQIATALETNPSVSTLVLARNNIGRVGAQAIAQALNTNTRLQKLVLTRNPITRQGANAFTASLEHTNVTLTSLELGHILDSKHLQYLLGLNHAGRQLLRQDDNNVPPSLWPLVLARISAKRPNALRYMVSAKPELFQQASR